MKANEPEALLAAKIDAEALGNKYQMKKFGADKKK